MSERSPSPEQIMDELLRLRARGGGHLDRLALLHEISVYQEELIRAERGADQGAVHARRHARPLRRALRFRAERLPDARRSRRHPAVQSHHGRAVRAVETGPGGVPLLGFVEVGDRPLYLDFLRDPAAPPTAAWRWS
jgi:hypothetical protein